MIQKPKTVGLIFGLGMAVAGAVQAATVGAVGATIDAGGPGFGGIAVTYDQSGLSQNYVSGVTDFDSFVASTTHDFIYSAGEWFSNSGTTAATVTYDLGIVRQIDKMALWNEDYSGIRSLDLFVSTDGVSFSALLEDLAPTNNVSLLDYAADVFSFQTTAFRYIRLAASGCPQDFDSDGAGHEPFNACAIGEVAFNEIAPIPLPGAGILLIGSLGGLGLVARRRRQIAVKG